MTFNKSLVVMFLAGCNIGPRVADPPDAALPPDSPPDVPSGFMHLLPAGANVPSVSTNAELLLQTRVNDGLPDAVTTIPRGTGKSNGLPVRFWNFGTVTIDPALNIAVLGPLYVIGRMEAGVFTPLPDHPPMIDTIPGDVRYSPIRRVTNVPVTDLYKGELITTVAALGEAIELGLVGDPLPDGTWVNMPVVLPTFMLDVGLPANTLAQKEVFSRGYRVTVFELGTSVGRQPLRFGGAPVNQASNLQSGVATGTPPTLPVAVDPQPVFQAVIPTGPPVLMPPSNLYTPLATGVTVRLADGIAPPAITGDLDLFRRAPNGAITSFVVDNVENFTIGTVTSNLQIQFAEGSP